jgi:hypothetical protein
MKQLTVIAVTVLLSLAPAVGTAQAQKPGAAKPAPAKPAAEVTAEKPASQAPGKPVATVARKSRAMEDARECLQFSTNTEVIKCAERFL